MLVQFPEQTIDKFRIPSFVLNKGEIIGIQIPHGACFRDIQLGVVDILIENNKNIDTEIALKYIEHIKIEQSLWSRFFPLTVGNYLDKCANKSNSIYKLIYDKQWITPKTKIKTLSIGDKRLLSLFTTSSWTNNIIFDLEGIDPISGKEIFNLIKTVVQSGGAAILIDYTDEFKKDCTTFVVAEYLHEK